MSKITKRMREAAAMWCGIQADYWSRYTIGSHQPRRIWPDTSSKVYLLIIAAMHEAGLDVDLHGAEALKLCWAEAEAMLRTGWEP